MPGLAGMPDRALELVTFPSDLGWMAALGHGKTLCRLVFGYRSPQLAVAALSEHVRGLPKEPISGRSWNPPWIARLQAFARGEPVNLRSIHVDPGPLTPFQQRVLDLCRQIPYGQTMTYGELAARVGAPRAARAVGNVMANNCVPLVIPCHRVTPAGGHLGGYSAAGGVRTKLRLLEAEAAAAPRKRTANRQGRVV